jgi:putative tryptophan/tyrosine transport system substrate-binding protein
MWYAALVEDRAMKRRDFITLLGGAAAMPLAAHAQKAALPAIGWLAAGSAVSNPQLGALRQSLGKAGYVEGRDFTIEARSADQNLDRLPELAAELVGRQVTMIVAPGVPAARAAKAATATIPIVFSMGADPVAFGFVASLNRPGGNLTGVANLGVGLGPKHLELLHEAVPAATVMGLLVNPANPSSGLLVSELPAVARKLGLELHILQARAESEFEPAFATLHQLGAGGLVISNEGLFLGRSEELAALALRHRMPAIHVAPDFVPSGGLMSYGGSAGENARLIGFYVARILKGEKPADLPVQQYTNIAFAINLKTAKALGLTVPLTLQYAADEVVE